MKKWLIIYDIRDKKRLIKAHKLISQYSQRVQLSVYELEADTDLINSIIAKLNKFISHKDDSVIFFDLCAPDWEKREKFGIVTNMEPEQNYYII